MAMHQLVSYNGRISEAAGAVIGLESNAALYGRGIFTTIAIRARSPLLWDKHWNRLQANGKALGLDVHKFTESRVRSYCDELFAANGVIDGRARITFLDERSPGLWASGTSGETGLLILTGEIRPLGQSFRLGVSPFRRHSRSPLTGIKSCNYLEQIVALDEAKSRGYDEALVLNEDRLVMSGLMSNVFWSKGDGLFTPRLATGCVAGTTREFLMEKVIVKEVGVGIETLSDADAIYLTSAGIGVLRVAEFEGRKLTGEFIGLENAWANA
ncbi:MAG: aminotransferase class IV [Pyrinomonadaceae bacterium]